MRIRNMPKNKTLLESAEELKEAMDRVHEARLTFLKAYEESLKDMYKPRPNLENIITYNKAEDGLFRQRVEKEEWD